MRKRNIPNWVGDLLLLLATVVWGGGFIGVSEALNSVSPFYMIAMRFVIGSLLMIVIFWKSFRKIEKKDLLPGIICGTMLFIGFAFQTTGAVYLSVGKLAFLTALNVIMVPFISAGCFKEKIYSYNMAASLIAVVGFGLLNLSGEGHFNFGFGEIMGILCAVGFATHISVLGNYTKTYDPIKLSIMQMITCAVLGSICALLFEEAPTEVNSQMLWSVGYLGVCSTFIGFLFQTVGQKYTSASRTAIILSMEAVFGILLSVIILKEKVTLTMGCGAMLILAAVIMAEYMHARMESKGEVACDKENKSQAVS